MLVCVVYLSMLSNTGFFATSLFTVGMLFRFGSVGAIPTSRGCARLPAGGHESTAQCVRFDSFSAGNDSEFTCAPLRADSLQPDDWTAGLRPIGERRCSDWDGSAIDTGCTSLELLAWRDVVFIVLVSSISRLRDVELWYKGEVAGAPLLVLEVTGQNHSEAEHWAALFSARYEAVTPGNSSNPLSLALAARRASALVSCATFPHARFYVSLHDDVSIFPDNLLSLLRTAEDAFGVAQAYELGSVEYALPWHSLYGFGFGAAGGMVALSRFAAQKLADLLANEANLATCASLLENITTTHLSKAVDAAVTCALRGAGIITVHCGHFLTHAEAYLRRHLSNSSLYESIIPLPGNPVAMIGTSRLPSGSQLCMLPGSVGDPFCLAAHPALAWLETKARASATRSEAAEVHAVLSHFNEPQEKVEAHIKLLRSHVPALTRIFVYSKGTAPFPNATVLPNVGRESHTYLSHIVRHFHALPSLLIFVQAVPNNYEIYAKRLAVLSNHTGLLNLGGADASTCEGSEAYKMVRLREIYVLTHRTFCPREPFISFMNGQFAVSRHRVLANPLHVYKYLADMLDAPPSHFVHADVEDIWPDLQLRIRESSASNNANYFSFVMERAWTVLFRCRIVPQAYACCSSVGDVCAAGSCQCED